MSGTDFFVCPHCQAQRPRWQVCTCSGAVAAQKVRRADRERRAELRALGVPVPPHRLRQGGRVKEPKGIITFTIPAMLCTPHTGKGKNRVPDVRKPKLKKLIGYYTRGSRPDPLRLSEYQTWKAHVQRHAPRTLPRPSREKPVELNAVCYFASGTHADPENVRKSICDALFPPESGGDKYVYGMHQFPQYDPENPRVEVTIRVMEVNTDDD